MRNPYGWTAKNVHGDLPVVKVNFVRHDIKYNLKAQKERKIYRFSKPADVFLKFTGRLLQ